MGTYVRKPNELKFGRPVYEYNDPKWGAAYLYFDKLSAKQEYWIVGPKVGSVEVNLYAASLAGTADQVRGPSRLCPALLTWTVWQIAAVWHVADPVNHKFNAAPYVESGCERALAVEPVASGCQAVRMDGLSKKDAISHRMGKYVRLAKQYRSRPVFEMYTSQWGAAYLYYEKIKATEHYWVIGSQVGGINVQLYSVSEAKSPDLVIGARELCIAGSWQLTDIHVHSQIKSAWHAADPAHNTFVVKPAVSAQCAAGTQSEGPCFHPVLLSPPD
jgi:hypothetical protein